MEEQTVCMLLNYDLLKIQLQIFPSTHQTKNVLCSLSFLGIVLNC